MNAARGSRGCRREAAARSSRCSGWLSSQADGSRRLPASLLGRPVCLLTCECVGTRLFGIKQGVSHRPRCPVRQGPGSGPSMRAGRWRHVLIHRRISRCASGPIACGRRHGRHASRGERFVCRTRAALRGEARGGCRIVRKWLRAHLYWNRGGSGDRIRRMNGTPIQRPRSGSALHIRNISGPVDSCDAIIVACRGNPSCETLAGRRSSAAYCTDKSCESRRRKAPSEDGRVPLRNRRST